jgi:hypothetical protein
VDEIHEPPQQVGVGRGQHAVAEVEDVAGPTGSLVEDGQSARPRWLPAGKQAGWIEVALNA